MSGSDDFFLGAGAKHQAASLLPSDEAIHTRIGPALLDALREDGGSLRREGALIALGKLHPKYKPEGTTILEVLQQHLTHSQQSVADTAIVAMGLTGDVAVVRTLLSIVADDEEGRALMKSERIPARVRALAALSLGHLAETTDNVDVRRYIVHGLRRVLEGESLASPDLHVACLTTIGFAPLPEAPAVNDKKKGRGTSSPEFTREGQLEFLIGVLSDTDRQEVVRAHAPKAIASLASTADARHQELALDALLDALENGRKSPRLVRHGLVEALGVLADSDEDAIDKRARLALHGVVANGQPVDRGLALVALGLASSRPGEGAGDALASFEAERSFLTRYSTRGKSNTRSWAMLALGLQGHHINEAGGKLSSATGHAVEATFETTRSPLRAGAQAIALGLRRDIDSGEVLIERLENESDETLRAQIAIALGLLGEPSAITPLEEVMHNASLQPMLLRDSSIALAMLGHKGVVLNLVEVIRNEPNHYTKGAAVTALGFVGDTRAVEPLLELLVEKEQSDQARGFAAMALGVICEDGDLPWKAGFGNHLNYHAMTYTLNNSEGTGIINFR